MDVANGLLEVEVFVLLRWGDAHVAAGGKAPVGGLDLLAVHQLHQPRHGLQLGLGEAVLQPRDLPVEIDGLLELLDGGLALFVELLHQLARGAAVVGGGHGVIARQLAAKVGHAGGELVEQVHLLDEATDRLSDGIEGLAGVVLLVVRRGERLCVTLTEAVERGEQLGAVGLVWFPRLVQFGGSVRQRLFLVGVEVGVLRHDFGERLEALAQVGERALESGERSGMAALSVQT